MLNKTRLGLLGAAVVAMGLAALGTSPSLAQGGRPPAESWWVTKTKGGVYIPPNRPLWKLADLKKMHAGQSNWQQPIVRDAQTEATYNSAAPGTKFGARMEADTPTVFIVTAGEVHFNVEGQQPITATRGAIVNILQSTIFSYDVEGAQDALWVEIHARGYKFVYPSSEPQPKPGKGEEVAKVIFGHKAPAYTGANKLMVNPFEVLADCKSPQGFGVPEVDEPHFAITLGVGYVNAADNPCGTGNRNLGTPEKPGEAFDTNGVFGHMHAGEAEWWVIQAGDVVGRFEGKGVFHATEGDVMYAAPPGWHQMGSEAKSGVSVRTAIFATRTYSMNSGAGGGD